MIDTEVEELSAGVQGRVLRPTDEGFEEAARPWTLAVQHHPDVLLEAAGADDVVAGVRWAAARGLPVAVQSGGHGATESVPEGLLISTRRMAGVTVDPGSRIARAEAGARWADVLRESVPHGLAGLCGSSSDVGVVGYCLGGGLPIVGRAFGFASDRIRSIDVVTPDGELRRVDREHEPELFGALRGGKGNFGVVTALELELVPVDEFYGGGIMYPGEDAAEVISAFRAWVQDLPDEACPSFGLLRLPPADFVPEPLRGKFLVHVRFAFLGGKEEGDRLLAPMRAVSTPIMDAAGPIGYGQIDLVNMDPTDPTPFEGGWMLLKDFDADVQDALLRVAGPGAETPLLLVEVRLLGGALARPSETVDAVSGRDAAYAVNTIGVLAPPVAEFVPMAIAEVLAALEPWSTGYRLVNFEGRPGSAEDRARVWTTAGYDAVTKAKRRWDPANMMRFGHAVLLPSGEPAEPAIPL
ncbi:MAG: FAD-binding oxidoreductase [Amnibacterium sp.]